MFSETRYAMNGDLRVAYRTSREGPRDIVLVSNWFRNLAAHAGQVLRRDENLAVPFGVGQVVEGLADVL